MGFDIQKKWFLEDTPLNAKKAYVIIGEDENGTITVEYNKVGIEGNEFSIEFIAGEEASTDLSAILANGKITVTLATDESVLLDNTKNTATLIAEEINKIDGFTAIVSGDGTYAFASAVEETDFANGQYGTVVPMTGTILYINSYYYINIAPNSKYDSNWRRFQLASY